MLPALRALYPGALVHTFHGTGHASSVLEPEAYAEAVRGLLTWLGPLDRWCAALAPP